MVEIQIKAGHIIGWRDGQYTADVAWWVAGQSQAERTCGIAVEMDVMKLIATIENDPALRPCWTALRTVELTGAELAEVPDGTELHFTNWPGKPSVPVTRVHRDHAEPGNIRFPDGKVMSAMNDELTRVPRAGLEA